MFTPKVLITLLSAVFALSLLVFSPCPAQAAPQAPGNFHYTLSGSVLTLYWDASSGAEGYSLGAGFQPGVYVATASLGGVIQLGPVDISTVPAGTYYLAVKASGGGQQGPYSNEIAITWDPAGAAVPNNLRYSLNGTQMTISWDPVAGASTYLFNVGFVAGNYVAAADLASSAPQLGPFDISLVPYGTYYLAVQSVKGGLASGHSNEVVVKISPPASQPVSLTTVADALFTGMDRYDPVLAPALTQTIISTFQTGGAEGLANLATTLGPKLTTKIPNGILLNFGSGYTTKWGAVLTGSVAITHSNVSTSGSHTTGNFSVEANNVTRNGVSIADGAVSGSIDATVGAGNTVVGDVSVSGILSGSAGPANVSGTAHFDTAVCPNYPISGSLTITTAGQPQTINFNNRCDGTYDSGGSVLSTLQQTTYINANFTSWSRWDSSSITPHYQDRTVIAVNYFSPTVVPLSWNGTSFSAIGSLTSTTPVDIHGTVSDDGRTLLSLSAAMGAYYFTAQNIPISTDVPGLGATYLMSGASLQSHISVISLGSGYTYVATDWANTTGGGSQWIPPVLTVLFSTVKP